MTTPQPLTLLVVDDNRDAADSLAALLRLSGHEVRVAYSGAEALRLAREHPPDGVFLDIGMPGLDGCAVARRLRAEATTRAAKLVALTAYNDDARAAQIQAAGFDRHLVKGSHLDDLAGVLTMMQQIKELARTTEQLARRNAELADRTSELLKEATGEFRGAKAEIREVKEEFREVKEELREVKEGLQEVKEELKEIREGQAADGDLV